jgi:N-acetylneuraminic acid mutarotase
MVANEKGPGSLLLFGGADYVYELDPNFFHSFTPSATLWEYKTSNRKWTALTPSGMAPSARNGCTADAYQGAMYMFGGLGKFLAPNGELWRYDIDANAWAEIAPTGPTPPARFISASVVDPDTGLLYLYNGLALTADGFDPIGDFWVYDIAQNTWRQLESTPAPPRAKGVLSILRGPCDKKYLVYTGGNIDTTVHCEGFDENTTATNEIWAFDVQAETWQKLDTIGTAPRVEFAQGATLNNEQYVIGGWMDVPDPVRICRQVWNETVYKVSLVNE